MPVPEGFGSRWRPLLSFLRVAPPTSQRKEEAVSRFRKLSHCIWHSQYHITQVPKYRYRILVCGVREAVEESVHAISGFLSCEVQELNVQRDHVHLVVLVPSKLSISDYLGRLKGQIAMKLFRRYRELRKKPYWGNHFWAKGYCVDTVGLDPEMIHKYVRYQERRENLMEQLNLDL